MILVKTVHSVIHIFLSKKSGDGTDSLGNNQNFTDPESDMI